MAPALSPSSRVRSRTSDISDFLRGRSDPKPSTDSLPPPVPHLPDPVTPTKNKSKFAFLGRKRKPSFTPSSAKAEAQAAVAATTGVHRDNDSKAVPQVPGLDGHQPSPAGPGISPQKTLPALPPVGVAPLEFPGSRPGSSRPNPSFSIQHTHQATPTGIPHHVQIRKQKGSSESTRRSNESRSMRPIITVSPPHSTMHEGEGAYTTPRTAPSPSRIPSRPQAKESALSTPSPSDRTVSGSDSPTSVDIPSSATSTTSVAQHSHPADSPLPVASSYKEETLLRMDHFDIAASDASPRRGTVSFNSPGKLLPATVGPSFSPSRQERRHVSVVQLNRLKKEIIATAPKIRKKYSDPTSVGKKSPSTPSSPRGSSTLVRSNTVSISPSNSPQCSPVPTPQGSYASTAQGRRIPPPLKRTWHTPPNTGPPKEPLPSPPASAALIAQTPTTAESFRTAPSPSPTTSPSPNGSRRPLPPFLLSSLRDSVSSSRAQGATSPDSSLSVSIPPSPSQSEADVPVVKTPVREDPAQRVLADEYATTKQLREALELQVEKYARLSKYMRNMIERHASESAVLMRKVEVLEKDAARREHEMQGLKWLVSNAGRNSARTPVPASPAREDSSVLPGSRIRSGSQVTTRSRVGSLGMEARVSFDSPAGSVEEGLAELQSSISEFIAPSPSTSPPASEQAQDQEQQLGVRESPLLTSTAASGSVRTRFRRANTVPDGVSGVPHIPLPLPPEMQNMMADRPGLSKQSAKAARRTSSPVIPSVAHTVRASSLRRSFASVSSPNRTGLGLGIGTASDVSPPRQFSRSPSPEPAGRDPHARSDSSTLSSLPSLSTIHSSSSGLSSIPETPRTDLSVLDDAAAKDVSRAFHANPKRLSSSSVSSSTSGDSSRVSASPSIGQVLDRTRAKVTHQPEMDVILRKLRAFGHGHSP